MPRHRHRTWIWFFRSSVFIFSKSICCCVGSCCFTTTLRSDSIFLILSSTYVCACHARVCACTMCAYTTQKSSLQSSNFLNCRARIFTRGRNYVISQILCYNLGTERNRIHGTFARKREQVRERKKERDKRESRAPKCYQKANMYAQILNWQRIYACVNIYVYIHEICISDNCMINACVCVYI